MKITNPLTGIEMNVEDTGGGARPMVMLHGYSGNLSRWRPTAELLRGEFRIVTHDLRGHGLSAKEPELDYSIAAHAEDLAGLMDALGLDRAIIAGHSMGGMIAQRFALDHPERVEKLILCATTACLVRGGAKRAAVGAASRALGPAPGIAAFFIRRKTRDKPRELFPEKDNPELEPGRGSLMPCFRALAGFDVRAQVGAIAADTLVISSSADELVAPALVRELAESIPGAKLVVIENQGHYVPIDRPAEVAEAIRAFLESRNS